MAILIWGFNMKITKKQLQEMIKEEILESEWAEKELAFWKTDKAVQDCYEPKKRRGPQFGRWSKDDLARLRRECECQVKHGFSEYGDSLKIEACVEAGEGQGPNGEWAVPPSKEAIENFSQAKLKRDREEKEKLRPRFTSSFPVDRGRMTGLSAMQQGLEENKKITKKQLQQIIKEELAAVLDEMGAYTPVPDEVKQVYLKWEEYELTPLLDRLRARQVNANNSDAVLGPSKASLFQNLINWASKNKHPARKYLLAYRNAAVDAATGYAQGKNVGDEWAIGPIENIRKSLGI